MRVRLPPEFVALGTVVDLVVERDGRRTVYEFPKPAHWLCTDEGKRTLYLFPVAPPKVARAKPVPESADLDQRLRVLQGVFRMWNDFEPIACSWARFRLGKDWRHLGTVVRVCYRCKKWNGKPTNYEHAFDDPPRVAQHGQLYRISGGVKVTPAGITG